ncbi:6-phospho-beta-glucosidase [Lacrimispora brassicae]
MNEKKGMKFTIVGAGSSYTPELLDEMAMRKEDLPVKEIMLYDIDEKRLEIMKGFCQRFAYKIGLDTKIESTMDLNQALYGADFVDTQVRVGGNTQRVFDEKIPLQYGLVGQETTGAGGMMKAMRTIPVMLEVAGKMEELSPDGWIINYTNPTGLVTEAVTKYTKANIAGFCSGGIFPKMWAKAALGVSYDQVQYDYAGLNHMNFISNITIGGRPVTEEEFIKIASENDSVNLELIKLLGVIPSPYLQWYYHTTEKVQKVLSNPLTRGEEVKLLEQEVYEAYADKNNSDKPEALAKRGGGGYSEVAMGFVNAVYNNVDTEMVVNVSNHGAIQFLPDSAVVEIGCLVNSRGMAPLNVSKIPQMCWGLIAAVKNYEQLAVEAAVEGDIRKAKLALLAHPLVREYDLVEKLIPELFEANKEYLPQFFQADRL